MAARRLWLCLPPVVFALGDGLVTLRGQPAEYWAGNYTTAKEANLLVHWLMTIHPTAYALFGVFYLVVCTLAILKTPRLVARLLSLALTYSHAFFIGTWLYMDGNPTGYSFALAVCIVSAIASVLVLEATKDSP